MIDFAKNLSKINYFIFVIVLFSVTLIQREIECKTFDDSNLLCTDEFCNVKIANSILFFY